jgi:antitoxin component YwqK of YwqJK toxin-antitoxin module
MKNTYTILLLLIIPLFGKSQFKTTYDSNGNPLSEIIDANSMRLGTWSYYNFNDELIRIEEYQNHNIITRKHIINKAYYNTISYNEEKLAVTAQDLLAFTALQTSASGEVLIDQNGNIVEVFFYSISDIKKIKTYTSSIAALINNNYVQPNNLLLTF